MTECGLSCRGKQWQTWVAIPNQSLPRRPSHPSAVCTHLPHPPTPLLACSYDACAVDVWASGVLLYLFSTGAYPFGELAGGCQGIAELPAPCQCSEQCPVAGVQCPQTSSHLSAD